MSLAAVEEEILRTLGEEEATSGMEDVVMDNNGGMESMEVEAPGKEEGLRDDDADDGRGSPRSRLGRAADELIE